MGFFPELEKHLPPPPAPSTRGSAKLVRETLAKGARGCEACPLQVVWKRTTSPKMPASGNLIDGDILVLGEAPMSDDDREGKAFFGGDGKLLKKAIPGREHDRLVFQNMVRCFPGIDVSVGDEEAHCCSIHLDADVAKLPIKAVLAVGQGVLSRLFPGAQMRDMHGLRFPVRMGEKTLWVFPIWDVAFLRRFMGTKQWQTSPDEGPAWSVFRADVRKFFKTVDKWPTPRITKALQPRDVLLPETEEEAREMLAAFRTDVPRAVDVETDHLRPYQTGTRLLTASISDGDLTISFPVQHPDAPNTWGLRLLYETIHQHEWIAHQAEMEWKWLRFHCEAAGWEWAPKPFHDTMAIARTLDARETALSLDDVSMRALGVSVKAISNINAKRIIDYPLRDVLRYGGLDTLATAKVWRVLHPQLSAAQRLHYAVLLGTIECIGNMALMGLDIDEERSRELHGIWSAKVQNAREIAEAEYEAKAFTRAYGRVWNIASPEDVGTALVEFGKLNLPKTAKGKQYATDDASLKAATGGKPHTLIDAVLEYRTSAKMIATYIDVVLEASTQRNDGRLHPSYTALLTATQRLSGEDPNIQNYPSRKHKELRSQVIAQPKPTGALPHILAHVEKKRGKKHLILKFDYKALEARAIACASKDKALCKSTIEGVDIHGRWRDNAIKVFPEYVARLAVMTNQTELSKILKGGRDIIKTDFVFASFYGASINSVAERTGMPRDAAEELSEGFWREFYGVKNWVKQQRATYAETGSVFTLTGRERHALLTGNEPLNNAIQGTGADVVAEAMNALVARAKRERDMYFHPRIQIHDDLTFILADDGDLPLYIDAIAQELVAVRFDWQIVPFAVEGSIGDNWAEMHEFCNITGEYVR